MLDEHIGGATCQYNDFIGTAAGDLDQYDPDRLTMQEVLGFTTNERLVGMRLTKHERPPGALTLTGYLADTGTVSDALEQSEEQTIPVRVVDIEIHDMATFLSVFKRFEVMLSMRDKENGRPFPLTLLD